MMNIKRISSATEFRADETLPESPFRCRDGMQISRQTLHTGTSALSLVNDPVNAAVLGAVNKLLFATEYHITDILTGMGVECRYSDIRNRMFRMAGAGLLEHYQYGCEGQGHSRSFFCLGRTGRTYMESRGKSPYSSPYDPAGDPARILKLLAVNQFLTKTGTPVEAVRIGVKVQVPGNTYRAFRPQAILERDGRTLFLEGVRRDRNWIDGLSKKLARTEITLAEKTRKNISVENPCVILIGEDTAHCREMMGLLEKERYSFDLWYTSDDIVYRSPGECLYELAGGLRGRLRDGIGFWQQIFGLGN